MLSAEHRPFILPFVIDQGNQLSEGGHGGGEEARPRTDIRRVIPIWHAATLRLRR